MIEKDRFEETCEDAFIDRPLSKLHKFYLVGGIGPPTKYVKWFEVIRTASPDDVVMLHINSPGGDLFTAIQFMRVMRESRANIVASVEGACMSAASIIFLTANHFEISDHSVFMFHNYSTINAGKGGEIYDSIIHERGWSEALWRDVYSGFLKEPEIKSILDNKDIWMTGEEVSKRLFEKAKIAGEEMEMVTTEKTSAAAAAILPRSGVLRAPKKKVVPKKAPKKKVVPKKAAPKKAPKRKG